MKARIHDVAERAGVSMKTVSRVLNREPNVAETTRERVLEAARELRYSPSLAARGLATSKNFLLALLYDNVSPSYILKVQQGATNICQEAGYHLIVHPLRGSLELSDDDVMAVFERLPVDGVILTSPLSDNPIILGALEKLGIRHIAIGASVEAKPASGVQSAVLGIDNFNAARDMTRFLIKSGHRDIGFIKGDKNHLSAKLRYDGFKAEMGAHGLALNKNWIVQGNYTFTSGEVAARDVFSRPARPSAIFASNDDMAAGVMAIAGHMGISVPDDLSIGGFDDTNTARILWPRLSTIRQPAREMGGRAASVLIDSDFNSVRSDESERIFYEHQLVIRESTKAV